jgi:hypothetical protein
MADLAGGSDPDSAGGVLLGRGTTSPRQTFRTEKTLQVIFE